MQKLFCIFILIFSTSVFAKSPAGSSDFYTEDKTNITVSSEQSQFVIKLRSNPTTGYSWFLREYDKGLITPVKHHYEPAADKKLMGAPGYELWTFRIKPAGFVVPQQTTIRLVYVRPWTQEEQSKLIIFRVSTISSQ